MNYQVVDAGLRRLCSIQKPGERFTLEAIANECGVSRERIRQIECAALDKLSRKAESRHLYAELFGAQPVKKESYFERKNRRCREAKLAKAGLVRKPGVTRWSDDRPKWTDIAQLMGITTAACHMIYRNNHPWVKQHLRNKLRWIMEETGTPPTRRPLRERLTEPQQPAPAPATPATA